MSVRASSTPPGDLQTGGLTASFPLERTLRVCLLGLYTTAAFWLVLSSILSLIVSIKFHSPDFLADPAWLTYGRVRAASTNLFLYGFCIPGGLGVALWVLVRTGRSALVFPSGVILGTMLLNIGVALGLGGILSGDLNGYETLEMPRYSAMFFFLGYVLAGASAVLTLHFRGNRRLTVPQWFLLAGIFWFPWIYSTANLLLLMYPVRGVAQSVVAWWYAANLQLVWLGLTGLAAAFYLLPRFLGRNPGRALSPQSAAGDNEDRVNGALRRQRPTSHELNSPHLALFAFWMLVLFGSWTGVPPSAPVPAWMPSISTVATVLTSLLFVAVFLVASRTTKGSCRSAWRGVNAFVSFGICSFLAAGLLGLIPVIIGRGDWITFTWLGPARWQFAGYGFFALIVFACVHTSLREFSEETEPALPELPRPGRIQFWLASLGTVLIGLPLAGAGILQGVRLRNPDIPFVDVTKATLHFLRISTIGDLLVLAANIMLLFSLISFIARVLKARARSAIAAATVEVPR